MVEANSVFLFGLHILRVENDRISIIAHMFFAAILVVISWKFWFRSQKIVKRGQGGLLEQVCSYNGISYKAF